MKKLMLLFCGMMSFFASALAQGDDFDNMVANGDFENIDGRLKKPGQIGVAVGWQQATGVKADLYAAKAKNPLIGIPDNRYGRQLVDQGNYYAGIVTYAYQNKIPRSYLTTSLTTPMVTGAKYCVKMDVSLSDLSKYASNNMGIHFSKKKVAMDHESHLAFKPVVHHIKNALPISEMDIWQTVCNVYEAKGGEKNMTIGNFNTNAETTTLKLKRPKRFTSPQVAVSYFYIDNVRVYLINSADECNCEVKKPTPRTKFIYSSQTISETELKPAEIVESVNVYFDFIDSEIQSAGYRDLDILARMMMGNPAFRLNVKAHIDEEEAEKAKTKPEYVQLAQHRADAVVEYLLSKGVAEDRLSVVVIHDKEPVDTSGSNIGKAKNRRIEFEKKNE